MAVSIEVRNGYINLIEAKVGQKILIKKMINFEFESDWMNPKGIESEKAFADFLSGKLKEANILDKNITLCLNNSAIISRELTIPRIDSKRTPIIVRNEMLSSLNLSNDYLCDYVVLEEFEKDKVPMQRVLAVAILETGLTTLVSAMRLAQLNLKVVDISANSIMKLLLKSNLISKDENIIIADLGNDYLHLFLYQDRQYFLSRNIRIDKEEASSNQTVVDLTVDNLNKMIQYSYTLTNKRGIDKIILMGNDDYLQEIQVSVQEDLSVICEIYSQPDFVDSKYPLEARYCNALGALIRK